MRESCRKDDSSFSFRALLKFPVRVHEINSPIVVIFELFFLFEPGDLLLEQNLRQMSKVGNDNAEVFWMKQVVGLDVLRTCHPAPSLEGLRNGI